MIDGIANVVKVASKDYLADLFTKAVVAKSFKKHVEGMNM